MAVGYSAIIATILTGGALAPAAAMAYGSIEAGLQAERRAERLHLTGR